MTQVAFGVVNPNFQSPPKDNGTVNNGGKVQFYAASSTTPLDTYSDAALTSPNTNPVVLDVYGRAAIYLSALNYKIDVQTSAGVSLADYPRNNAMGLTPGNVTTYMTAPTYRAKSGAYTALAWDYIGASSTFTLTLPAAVSNANTLIWVANIGVGTITIGRTGSDTIGLATSQTLNPGTASAQGDSFTFISDGVSNWGLF